MTLGDLPSLGCPCGSPASLARCCGRFHAGTATAATAEELMRSRYAAFATGDEAYLLRSWHPDTRPPVVASPGDVRWTGLRILATEAGRPGDHTGQVEFEARFVAAGRPGVLHEVSRFARWEGEWVYVDGTTPARSG
jgi:SEC-C motif-containing protein